MRRVPFWVFADDLRKQGFSDEKIREIINKMIEEGLAEGDDVRGYTLTEEGVVEVERRIFRSVGVV